MAWFHLRGHPHGNTFVFKRTCSALFRPIVHKDPVNAFFFFKPGLRLENLKTLPLHSRVDGKSEYFGYRPIPQPLAFDLLIPWHIITTTTMVDYMLVFVPQKILSLLGQNIMLLCHYAEPKDYGQPTSHFHLLLGVFGFLLLSACIQSASFMPMLRLFCSLFGEFQAPPIG